MSEELKLLNLLNPRTTISPFSIEEENLKLVRSGLGFLCHMAEELSKPIQPRAGDIEYIPTQYLCEFIKSCDYDGVLFKSSLSEGHNLILFKDDKVTPVAVHKHQVISLEYQHRNFQ